MKKPASYFIYQLMIAARGKIVEVVVPQGFTTYLWLQRKIATSAYSRLTSTKCGTLAGVAGYEVLYSHPRASNFLASDASDTAAMSTMRLRRAVSIVPLCMCSAPFSSTSFHFILPVAGSSPIFSKAIGWFGKPAALQRLHSCIFLCGLDASA